MSTGRARAVDVWSEACRDVRTGTSRILGLTIVLTAVVVMCVLADLLVVTRLLTTARTYVDSGAATWVLHAPGRVAADACERLGEVGGVRDAGSLRRAPAGVSAARLPESGIPVYEVTAGMAAALAPRSLPGAGILLSTDVATTFAVAPGDDLVTTSGVVRVLGTYTYPDDGRRAGLGYAAAAPVPASSRMDECRITVWPQSPERVRLLWSTLRDPDGPETDSPRVYQLNTRLGTTFTGPEDLRTRPSRFAPLVAGVAALGLGAVAVRRRRLELAAARHLGMGRATQLALLLTEAAAPVIATGVLVLGAAAWPASGGAHVDPTVLTRTTLATLGTTCSGFAIGVTAATLSVGERQLLRYFRHR